MDFSLLDIVHIIGDLEKKLELIVDENVLLRNENLVLQDENTRLVLDNAFMKADLDNLHIVSLDKAMDDAEKLSAELSTPNTLNVRPLPPPISRKDTRLVLQEKCNKLEGKLLADKTKIAELIKNLNVYIKRFQEINGTPITSKQLTVESSRSRNQFSKTMIESAPTVEITKLSSGKKKTKERIIAMEYDRYLTFMIKKHRVRIDISSSRIEALDLSTMHISYNYHNKEEAYLIKFKDENTANKWLTKFGTSALTSPREEPSKKVEPSGPLGPSKRLSDGPLERVSEGPSDRPSEGLTESKMVSSQSDSNISVRARSRAITDNQVPSKIIKYRKSNSRDLYHQRTVSESRTDIEIEIRTDASGRKNTVFEPMVAGPSGPIGSTPRSMKWLARSPSNRAIVDSGSVESPRKNSLSLYKKFQSHSQGEIPQISSGPLEPIGSMKFAETLGPLGVLQDEAFY